MLKKDWINASGDKKVFLTKNITNNKIALVLGITRLLLAIIVLTGLLSKTYALNADSLGGNPWSAYLRSDVSDTAEGNQYLPGGATIGTWGAGEFKTPFCTQLSAYNALGAGYFGSWSMYGSGLIVHSQDPTLPRGNPGITFNVRGVGAKGAIFQYSPGLTPNEYAALIYLTGNSVVSSGGNPTEMIRIGEIPQGGHGIGNYITSPNPALKCKGYYNDVGVNGIGVFNETNLTTRPGDYGQYNLLNYTGGGRGTPTKYYDRGSGGIWPMIVLAGDNGSVLLDSALIYRWGMVADSFRARSGFKGSKAEVDTVKTMLCGRRYFGNQQNNLCDTILVWGVAESTTVINATYGKDARATSWNGLQAWAGKDTIYIQRRTVSDPNNYYWRAEKIINAGQIQSAVTSNGVEFPLEPPVAALPAMVKLSQSYPNPAASEAFISYQVAKEGKVNLTVYNMLGQKVKILIEQPQPAGIYKIRWDGRNQEGRDVSAGVYIYELKTEDIRITKKLILAK